MSEKPEPGRPGAPEVVPEPGWRPIESPRLEGGRGSFVSGDPDGDRLRVSYFWRGGERPLVGRAWFGPGAEGPPGHAHGGSMAAVLDEAMGAAAWTAGHRVVAVQLDTSFRRLLPLGTDTWLEAWVEAVEGRKVRTGSRLLDDRGEVFAEAKALFVTLDPERFGPLLEKVTTALRTPPPRRPGGKEKDMNPEESAIREVIATWLRASAEGDTAKVLSLMTEDVVFLVAGRPPFGKAEFAAAQEGLAGHRIEAISEVREVRVSGDLAYCWTDLKISMTPVNGGPAVRRSGNTLTIFERQSDGKWLLSRDANLLMLVS